MFFKHIKDTVVSKKAVFLCASLLFTGCAFATNKPVSVATDQRIDVVNYNKMNVVPVEGVPYIATQILFSKGEYIEDVQNGDSASWTTSINKNMANMLFVKPSVYGSNTNMTVITNKHTYYFALTSPNQGEDTQPTYAIHFYYPQVEQAKVLAEIKAEHAKKERESWNQPFNHPEKYNWNYSYHGDKQILPTQIFDDGKFTYMAFKPSQEIPAIFAVNNAMGTESVVNYRREGIYIIIQQTAPQFTLRLGKHRVVSVFNNSLINRIKHNWMTENSNNV